MAAKLLRTLLASPVGAIFTRLGEKLLHPWPTRKLHFDGHGYVNRASEKHAQGCNLVGFASAEFGIGQHLRSTADACLAAEIPIKVFDYGRTLHPQGDRTMAPLVDQSAPHRGNIFCVNNDAVLDLWRGKRRLFKDRYNVAYGYWELSEYPEAWLPAMNIVDEVWAPSRFVRDTIADKTSVPVLHMPVAVDLEVPGRFFRDDFAIPRDAFVFLFSYDHSSTVGRKNPSAVIRAFRSAFPHGTEKTVLVLKSKTNEDVPYQVEGRETVRASVADDPRILLIDELFTREQTLDLVASADAYVSLHRAEGFGLGMAEAMKMGKAVIGTAYSGNTDFMSPANACLVDFELVEADPDQGFGLAAGSMWAEPDEDQAAHHMRQLVEDATLVGELGARARAFMDEHYNAAVVGQRYRERLQLIGLLARGS